MFIDIYNSYRSTKGTEIHDKIFVPQLYFFTSVKKS